ncbi:MAG: site-specific DNA-methyltransferase [Victivallales bacterium]|jgi:site-specific DNA-methyltransferase (adenine-specific)|nr:site-specific DNA-methyltransferase [Victivallales bacterium]
MTHHKIIAGDSRKLGLLKDKSVQLIITSPPYWQLKDYGAETQIGFNENYENYINNLNLVWQECYRVLADGCRLCVNIGDQFARSVYYGRYKVIPIRTEIIRFCETLGMDYMGAIIWQKSTTMNTTGGGAVMGSFPYPRNGILKIDYEFILIFKKSGYAPKPTIEQKSQSELTREEWNQYFASHWNFNGVKQLEHLAMFPEELPKRLIKMFSFVGETVFDPFLGSGTTSLAAMNLGRNSIGYEINRKFLPIIQDKVDFLVNDANISYDDDHSRIYENDFSSLPYIFKDPHNMDSKIDIKKLQFGSKITSESSERQEMFTVKRIISPETLLLNNGLTVKLIGVKENPDMSLAAVQFLEQKTARRKVFLKYDKQKYSQDNDLLCYLYLDNKTFINNHLIRTGFVDVDISYDYSCKGKFLLSSPL